MFFYAIRAVRMLREELQLLQEPGSYVGEVVKVMGKNKVLVKVHGQILVGSAFASIVLQIKSEYFSIGGDCKNSY